MNQSMERLRRARPAPAPLTHDPDELFAAIIAEPRDTATRRRPAHRRAVLVAVSIGAAIVLTAGSAYAFTNLFGWHDAASLVKTNRQWQKLYVAAQSDLTLPPGVSWPERRFPPNTVTSTYEPGGMAVGVAQTSWECYWAHAIQTGDVSAQQRAHAALTDLLANHVVVAPPGSSENVAPPASVKPPVEVLASDGGLGYMKRMYAEAAAGDPTMIAESCRANS